MSNLDQFYPTYPIKELKQLPSVEKIIECREDSYVKIFTKSTISKKPLFFTGGYFPLLENHVKASFSAPNKSQDVLLYKYSNAKLIGDSIVLSRNKKVAPNCVINKRFFNEKKYKLSGRGLKLDKQLPDAIKINEPCFFVTSSGLTYAYTHFFVEIITKLAVLKEIPNWENMKIIFSRQLKGYQLEIIKKIGIDPNNIIYKNLEDVYDVNELYLPSPTSIATIGLHKSCYSIYQTISNNFDITNVREKHKNTGPKIYVSRKELKWRREIINHPYILEMARKKGYKEIFPEEMNIDEKIYVFSNATHIIGDGGGGLTNTVFCTSQAKILTLSPQYFPLQLFTNIASYTKAQCGYVIGTSIERDNDPRYNESNFIIDEKDYIKALKALSEPPLTLKIKNAFAAMKTYLKLKAHKDI